MNKKRKIEIWNWWWWEEDFIEGNVYGKKKNIDKFNKFLIYVNHDQR